MSRLRNPFAQARRRHSRNENKKKQRMRALRALGGLCVRCGFSDPRALEIDHVNGDGDVDGPCHGNGGRRTWLYCKIANGMVDRSRFQVLCSNCHSIKTREERDWLPSERRDDPPPELPLLSLIDSSG